MPAVAAVAVPAVASIVGGLLGKPKQSAAQKQQTQLENSLLTQQASNAQYATEAGKPLLGQSNDLYGQAINYYKPLLSGDRQQTFNALAPERNQLANDYNQNLKTLQFAPRGGGRGAAMQDLDAKQSSAISNLLFQMRPQAANALTGIGGQLGAEGANLLNAGSGTNASTINSLSGLQNLALAQNSQGFNQSAQIGASIYQILSNPALLKALGLGSGGKGGSVSDSPITINPFNPNAGSGLG